MQTTHQLLKNHFLRRFLENDLISPNVDRHDAIVLIATVLMVPGLVVTVVLLGSKYLFGIPTPALTAVASLDDKFLYVIVSMLVMGLVAAVEWDALDLDARDEAILGPLPLTPGAITRAKLSALVIFASTFVIALNIVPSVVFPLLLVSHFHVDIIAVVRMIAMHALVTTMAGAWAFLTVVLIRQLLRLIINSRWFRRVSTLVQAALVLTLGSTLLLTPWIASDVPETWMRSSVRHALPPVWFVGLYESGTRRITLTIRGLGLRIPKFLVVPEANARVLYDSLLPRFGSFAEMALLATCATLITALALYAMNNRQLPSPSRQRGLGRSVATELFTRLINRRPLQRAGFVFTVQTLARSIPHRMMIASASAVAFSVSVLLMRFGDNAAASPPATHVLSVQTIVITIVLVGIRKALAIPAELRASWMFAIAWNGDIDPFIAGVKRAVMAIIIVPLLAILLVFDTYKMGATTAVEHASVGWVVALIVLEMLLRGNETVPLACGSDPRGNLKTLAPIYLLVLLGSAYGLARIERAAMADAGGFVLLLGTLASMYAGYRLWAVRRGSVTPALLLEQLAETPTQRLGLSEPV